MSSSHNGSKTFLDVFTCVNAWLVKEIGEITVESGVAMSRIDELRVDYERALGDDRRRFLEHLNATTAADGGDAVVISPFVRVPESDETKRLYNMAREESEKFVKIRSALLRCIKEQGGVAATCRLCADESKIFG